MRFLSRFLRARSQTRFPARLAVEVLEDRTVPSSATVVPFSQTADGVTTFYRLTDALKVATNKGDVVTILPGTTPDTGGPVAVLANGITIQGDPDVPASILAVYSLNVEATGVTLRRLNLGQVAFAAGDSNDTVALSVVNTVVVAGSASASGGNTIDQDQISGSVSITGFGPTLPTLGNAVTNCTFNSLVSGPILSAVDNTNLTIQNNTIVGGGPNAQVGIQVSRGLGNVIANNTISLAGNDATAIGIELDDAGGTQTTVTVKNNVVSTSQGIGLAINSFNDAQMAALVQGNDFHGNAIGVDYHGAGGATIGSNLGGTVGGSQFIGANNFRGYPAAGSSGSASILLSGVAAGATLSAQFNIFDPANPGATTFVADGNGTIDTSQSLSSQRSFVETLYNSLLGRVGSLGELDGWVKVLNSQPNGQAVVANGILRSNASLTRIVDSYYLKYLGRVADPDGAHFWVFQLQAGVSLEAVQAGFISSAEFIGNNNSDYVQGLYRTFLGRTGSAAELAYWYTQLQMPNGLETTALGFADSAENRGTFVQALYTTYLHRSASAFEQASLVNQHGDLLTLQAAVLSLPEYFTNG